MKISVDHYERDIIMETLQYRLEHDDHLIKEMTLKDNLEDLLSKLEEEDVYPNTRSVIDNGTVAGFEL